METHWNRERQEANLLLFPTHPFPQFSSCGFSVSLLLRDLSPEHIVIFCWQVFPKVPNDENLETTSRVETSSPDLFPPKSIPNNNKLTCCSYILSNDQYIENVTAVYPL